MAWARTATSIAAPTASRNRHTPAATTITSDHPTIRNQAATAEIDHRSGALAATLARTTGTETTVTAHANTASPAAAITLALTPAAPPNPIPTIPATPTVRPIVPSRTARAARTSAPSRILVRATVGPKNTIVASSVSPAQPRRFTWRWAIRTAPIHAPPRTPVATSAPNNAPSMNAPCATSYVPTIHPNRGPTAVVRRRRSLRSDASTTADRIVAPVAAHHVRSPATPTKT